MTKKNLLIILADLSKKLLKCDLFEQVWPRGTSSTLPKQPEPVVVMDDSDVATVKEDLITSVKKAVHIVIDSQADTSQLIRNMVNCLHL